MATALLNELGWNRDAIERQLAHSDRNGVRAAYNRTEFVPERWKMVQTWADYLDTLRDGAEIIPINKPSSLCRPSIMDMRYQDRVSIQDCERRDWL